MYIFVLNVELEVESKHEVYSCPAQIIICLDIFWTAIIFLHVHASSGHILQLCKVLLISVNMF